MDAKEISGSLGYIQNMIDFYHANEVVCIYALGYLLNWMIVFFFIQAFKRRVPAKIKRRMTDNEVISMAWVASFGLTLLAWHTFIPESPIGYALFNGFLIALILERNVNFVMKWSKKNKPNLYLWLRNDRYNVIMVKDEDDPTNYFAMTKIAADKTVPLDE